MSTHWRITAIEAATLLDLSYSGVYKAIARGELSREMIDGKIYLALDDVMRLVEKRRKRERRLSCVQVAKLLQVGRRCIQEQISVGNLRAVPERNLHGGYLVEPAAVVAYWREHMGGACVRCGILGEATEQLGFMCVACEHEVRTGKLYRWPAARQSSAVHGGRLVAWGLVE